jgi:hypothetical protein
LEGLVIRDREGKEVRIVDDLDHPGEFIINGLGDRESIALQFEGIRPNPKGISHDDPLYAFIDGCSNRLGRLAQSVHWLGAVRLAPERRFTAGTEPLRLGFQGKGAAELLAHVGDRDVLFESVRNSIQRMFDRRLELVSEKGEHSLELGVEGQPRGTSIVDVGEGVSQVFPVLVLLAMAVEGRFGSSPQLVLEQPEMHLHSQAEQVLAEILCEAAVDGARPHMLVETHSENLLLFVQLAVLKGKILPEDVAIYWLARRPPGECVIKKIDLDERGRPHGWPPGVFSEDVELARQILLARRGMQS